MSAAEVFEYGVIDKVMLPAEKLMGHKHTDSINQNTTNELDSDSTGS